MKRQTAEKTAQDKVDPLMTTRYPVFVMEGPKTPTQTAERSQWSAACPNGAPVVVHDHPAKGLDQCGRAVYPLMLVGLGDGWGITDGVHTPVGVLVAP